MNVGDDLSLPVARHFFASDMAEMPKERSDLPNLMLAGSILDHANAMSYVYGAGLIDSNSLVPQRPKAVYAVRGPLTRFYLHKQGIDVPETYGDPGVLMPELYPATKEAAKYAFGLIPHYIDKEHPAVADMRDKGVHILDVAVPPEAFIAELQQCETLFSSSLHGVILAHAYGRPALWVNMTTRVAGKGFKFYDYYASLGIRPEAVAHVWLQNSNDPEALAKLATLHAQDDLRQGLSGVIAETRDKLLQATA